MLDGNVDSCWDEVCVHDDRGVDCVKNAVASVVCFRGVENRALRILVGLGRQFGAASHRVLMLLLL